MIPPAFLTEIGGGVGSISRHIKKTRGYRGYIGCASSRLISLGPGISDNTNGKTQYDNINGIVLDMGVGNASRLPLLGLRIQWVPVVA